MKLEEKVRLPGNSNNLESAYLESDIFVLSSDYEGLPLCVLEAASAGVPVVATDVGGVSEAVHHGENGLLVDRGDAAGLARALQVLMRDSNKREAFGRKSRTVYEDKFRLSLMCDQLKKIYSEMINC